MKHQILLSWMLGMLCLATLSCSPKAESDDPFAGAKWIGTSEHVLYADYLPQFILSADIESYVRVELDREKKSVNVYRTGYTKADVPEKVFQSLAVADSLLADGPAKLTVQVTYNQLRISLGDVILGRVNVGPLGGSGDYIAYPQLADVGWMVMSEEVEEL